MGLRKHPVLSGATVAALLGFLIGLVGVAAVGAGSPTPWIRNLSWGCGLALAGLAGAWAFGRVGSQARNRWGAAVLAAVAVGSTGLVLFFLAWSVQSGFDDGIGLAVGPVVLAGLSTGGALKLSQGSSPD